MNETQQNLKDALELLKTAGRCIGELHEDGRYCPIGAAYAARTGKRGEDVNVENAYENTPEIHSLAKAVDESGFQRSPYRSESPAERVYRFNDTFEADDEVFSVMERAIEIAGVDE